MTDFILIIIFTIALIGFFLYIRPKKDKNCGCSSKNCKTKHYQEDKK